MVNRMNWKAKNTIKSVFLFLLNIGIDVRRTLSLRHYGKYRSQRNQFKEMGGVVTHNYAILSDYDDQAGSSSGHYFHQDLFVSQLIFSSNPENHIDIGSRIDGFVAHVASFRNIKILF